MLSPLEKLTRQIARLQESIKKEEAKETARFASLTWGHGMRHSKLPNNSARLGDLEHRRDVCEREIKKLTKPAAQAVPPRSGAQFSLCL